MKKFTTALAIVGAIAFVFAIVHMISWGNSQMEKTKRATIQWQMDWASRR